MFQRLLQHCIPKTYLEYSTSRYIHIYPLSITLPNQATACSFLCLASRNFFVSWQLPQGLPSLPGCLNIIRFHTWKPVRWTCISAWLDIKYCGKIFAQKKSSWPEGSWNMLLGVDVSVKPRKEARFFKVFWQSVPWNALEHKKHMSYELLSSVGSAKREMKSWQKHQLLPSMSC